MGLASASEYGHVGGLRALEATLPARPNGVPAQLLLPCAAGLGYLGYFSVGYFTPLDDGVFQAPPG